MAQQVSRFDMGKGDNLHQSACFVAENILATTGEVPRRHRHTTATPSEAPKNIAVQELLKDHE